MERTNRQTDNRQIDKKTERQSHKQTIDRETKKQRETERNRERQIVKLNCFV